MPKPGDAVGAFTLLRRIGEGGMGVVFEARNGSARNVALKILKPERAQNPQYLREFQDEARATGSVKHENVVSVVDSGEAGGLHYITMEYVDGPPLSRVLSAGKRVRWKTATRIVIEVARALSSAHEMGLIHRDVKPENILLYRDGRSRLTDFGIVKDISSLKGYLMKGRTVGTAAYASPEQCLGKRLCTATDMYSLGATFYHLLCGRQPFPGGTKSETMKRQVRERQKPLVQFVPKIPKALSNAVERMMAKTQADRVPSMERLISDLEMIMAGKVLIATPRKSVNLTALRGLSPRRRRIG